MKKLLSLIISAVLIFSVFPNMNVEAANTNKEAGKAYADIIQNYLTAAELGADAEVSDKINPEFLGGLYYSSGTMYRIMDYNNDGVPELFVGLKSSGFDSGTIYDVYTFYKGKAVQLMTDIGYRAGSCILCKNGIIKDIWADGATHSGVKFHKLPKNKNRLKTAIELEVLGDGYGEAAYTKIVNGKTTKISEKQYIKLYQKYDRPIKTTFYKADSKAISNIRNGSFTYQNQKNWKIKTGEKTDW